MNTNTAAEIAADFANVSARRSVTATLDTVDGRAVFTISRTGRINARVEIKETATGFDVTNMLAVSKFARPFPDYSEARAFAYEIARV
jgi:hypothetical protein